MADRSYRHNVAQIVHELWTSGQLSVRLTFVRHIFLKNVCTKFNENRAPEFSLWQYLRPGQAVGQMDGQTDVVSAE